ncbi:MAG: glycosyltransferase family 4 protein [Caulobacterales bacterium]|nr:glycosyltransferase family 4 protein [Caulobacterales bacterium]
MLETTEAQTGVTGEAAGASAPFRPLRILFASYRSHPHVGGQGVYVREVTKALADLGHHPEVVSGPPYPELDPRVPLHPLPSLDLFEQDNAFAAFRPSFLVDRANLAEWARHNTGAFGEPHAFALRLTKWLAARRGRYDVVHDNQGLASPMRRIARTGGAPLTATIHHPITVDRDLALAAEPSWWRRALVRRWHGFVGAQARTARSLPALLTVSQAAKARAVSDFGVSASRIQVAPNGVDHAIFHPDLDVRRDPDQLAATISSDTPIKGLEVLMRAFAQLAARFPRLKLTVIGAPREDGIARRLALACHGDRVRFVHGLDGAEVARHYARAAIVVSPSRYEGFGLPVAEAMACGAAVVTSDAGGLPEVVGDAGLLAPAGDAEALAAAISSLVERPETRRRLGERAVARACERFSWARHAEAVLQLYGRVGAC